MSTNAAAAPVPGSPVYRRQQAKKDNPEHYCEQLVVAVHGMGDQSRNDFVQTVASLFAQHCAQTNGVPDQATHLPVGVWDGGGDSVHDDAIGFAPVEKCDWLNPFAFAEVHWADLPREMEETGYRLQETTRWATSIVQRLSQRHGIPERFGEQGPQLAATVLEEIASTVGVLRRLLKLAERAGLGHIEVEDILTKFLGDVQQVTDFRGVRYKFITRFLERMENLASKCPEAEIHIIAHSEGSVMAFLTLLTALRGTTRRYEDHRPVDLAWIDRVRSFTTLGSPIDKHLILWPDMWFQFSGGIRWRPLQSPIRWHNYYDLADPVGHDLDTARVQLDAWGCEAFDFEAEHDHGFRRYALPGKAHVDYFGDVDLFGHIIRSAVEGKTTEEGGPGDRILGKISPFVPFLLVVALHFAAGFTLLRSASIATVSWTLLLSTILLATTALARIGRLSRLRGSVGWAMFEYVGLGGAFAYFTWERPMAFAFWLSVAAIVGAWWLDSRRLANRERPNVGLRWMSTLAGLGAVALLAPLLFDEESSALAIVLGGAGFVYLWRLGVLTFDLAYVWARFINRSSATMLDQVRQSLAPAAQDQRGSK